MILVVLEHLTLSQTQKLLLHLQTIAQPAQELFSIQPAKETK